MSGHVRSPNSALLTIGYSVLGGRETGIRLPTPRPDVEILVVIQGASAQAVPVRSDVRYVHLDSLGVAKSRNEVLRQARGEFVLFADDDVVLHEEGVRRLLEILVGDKSLALALGQAVDSDGRLRKRYPQRSERLHRWNAGKAATYEMMLRRSAFAAAEVRFDEDFGAGVEQYLGDEYVLIADAVRAGLVCRFFPVVLATHAAASSGSGFGTTRDAAARSAVFDRVFGRLAPVARLAFALRSPQRFGSVRLTARFVTGRFEQTRSPA
jgi:glycosyltransferase involved in cell wall biosynthesis